MTETKENIENDFEVFKTIEIVTYRSYEDLTYDIITKGWRAKKGNRIKIHSWAKDVIKKNEFLFVCKRKEIDLIVLSVAELGFEVGAEYCDIMERAKEIVGLGLCPAEAAPQLRIAYSDQPKVDCLIVAHEPIADSSGCPRLLGVDRGSDGVRWLSAFNGHPRKCFFSEHRFVFARRN